MRIITLGRSLRRAYCVSFSSKGYSTISTCSQSSKKPFSTSHAEVNTEVDSATYDRVCSETLEALTDYFEQIVEESEHLVSSDVSYGDGVLTVKFGNPHGTYVINRQTPNKQIWLSSPSSGPKRYDFVPEKGPDKGSWVYKHTGEAMHELLQREIRNIVKKDVDFFQLPFSRS